MSRIHPLNTMNILIIGDISAWTEEADGPTGQHNVLFIKHLKNIYAY